MIYDLKKNKMLLQQHNSGIGPILSPFWKYENIIIGFYTIFTSSKNANTTKKTLNFATKTPTMKLQPKKVVIPSDQECDDQDHDREQCEKCDTKDDQIRELEKENESLKKIVADFFKPSVP